MPDNGFTEPPQCMPDEFKAPSAIHAYWNYYIADKRKIANGNETPYDYIPSEVADLIRRESDNITVTN